MLSERYIKPEQPSLEKAIDFIKANWPGLSNANFIIDEEYYSPEVNDIKVTWAVYIYGGSFQLEEFSEQAGKTFQVFAYLVPKNGTFEIKNAL